MIANSVKISVFAKEDEDSGKIKEKLLELIPFDIDEVVLEEKNAKGFEEKEIKVFEVLLTKEKHVRLFLENLISRISDEAKELVVRHLDKRIDDECNFFLRLSKDKFVKENELWITDQGNCFHIKINIACFPKNKEKAIEIIRKVLKN